MAYLLRLAGILGIMLLCGLSGGCIADEAADSDLPWSTGQTWEGMGPVPSVLTDRYD